MPPRLDSLVQSDIVCPLCERQFLCKPTRCHGHFNLANSGRSYTHCCRHTFKKDSPCKAFYWIDDLRRWHTDRGRLVDNHALLDASDDVLREFLGHRPPAMDSFPDPRPPPPPTPSTPSNSQTPSTPSAYKTTCAKCGGKGAARCAHSMCAPCCRLIPLDGNGVRCTLKNHKYTTPPTTTLSPEVIAALPGQPQTTTYAHNVSNIIEQIFERDKAVDAVAVRHDRTSGIISKDITNSITVEVWSEDNKPSTHLTMKVPHWPYFNPVNDPVLKPLVTNNFECYSWWNTRRRVWEIRNLGFHLEKDTVFYLRHPSVTSCPGFAFIQDLVVLPVIPRLEQSANTPSMSRSTSFPLPSAPSTSAPSTPRHHPRPEQSANTPSMSRSASFHLPSAPSTPRRPPSLDFLPAASPSKRRVIVIEDDDTDIEYSPTKRSRPGSITPSSSMDNLFRGPLFPSSSATSSASDLARSLIRTNSSSSAISLQSRTGAPSSSSDVISISSESRPSTPEPSGHPHDVELTPLSKPSARAPTAKDLEANLLSVLNIKLTAQNLAAAPSGSSKAWPLLYVRDMVDGFIQMRHKKGKRNLVFPQVFGRPWHNGTFYDNLGLLKYIKRSEVERLISEGATWEALRLYVKSFMS